jgi:hypothetical protein
MQPALPVSFPLRFRIPTWAGAATIAVNGKPVNAALAAGFAKIERTWTTGDLVELQYPMLPRISRGYNDSVSLERGPLVFSFPVGESWVKLRDRGMTADWQVFPSSQWNYALAFRDQNSEKVEVEELPIGESPFSLATPPIKLRVQARKLTSWRAVDGVADPVPQSPVSSSEPTNTVSLVPYAAAKLRITAFPELQS